MPVNWLLESWKWKILVKPILKINIVTALKSVLAGLSAGFITPRSLGDYYGRLIVFKNGNISLIGALITGRLAQLSITLLGGLMGVLGISKAIPLSFIGWLLALVLALTMMFLLRKQITKTLGKWHKNVQRSLMLISGYGKMVFLLVITISALRYAVFIVQFFLLFRAFDIELHSLLIFQGISFILLFKSIVPSVNFMSDLGIREMGSYLFFDYYNLAPVAIQVSLIIWCINILFPVLAGALITFLNARTHA